ncbi:hypothetical protein DL767_000173 [Monosporascus sp. MG133]|nr:hypothetical protein DL767_000173 [Monosporascus sp. MG133]
MIKARLAREKQASHDLYSFMVDAVDAPEGDKVTLNEIWSEAIFFMPAAGDTISTTLMTRSKTAHSSRAAVTSCLHRRGPANVAAGYRHVMARAAATRRDAPWVVDGQVIPRDVLVGVNIYSIHHNEEYFPDPFRYNPERWLNSDDAGSATAAANRAAFVPFSLGARACAGRAMAYLEIRLTMAKTLWYFDFKPADRPGAGGEELNEMGEFLLHDIFTSSHDGPYLTFRSRGSS